MRILQVTDSYRAAGGLESFVHTLSQKILNRGHDTEVASLDADSSSGGGSDSYNVVRLDTDIGSWQQYIHTYDPDIVIWHTGGATAEIISAVARSRVTVSTVHGVMCPSGARLFRDVDELCGRKSGLGCLPKWYIRQCGTDKSPFKAIENLNRHKTVLSATNLCERVYAVSDSVRGYLELEGVTAHKIRVFDNTLGSLSTVPPLQIPVHGDTLRLLYVGRLVYEKGVQYLIRAVSQLRQMDIDVVCSIVGDGWYRTTLEGITRSLELTDIIRFEGKVPGVAIGGSYRKSDIVVVPSIWPDPSPLVVAEARGYGKPVFVTDVGGLPESVEFVDGVYVVRHADSGSLATAIAVFANQTGVRSGDTAIGTKMRHVQAFKRIDILSDILEGMSRQTL